MNGARDYIHSIPQKSSIQIHPDPGHQVLPGGSPWVAQGKPSAMDVGILWCFNGIEDGLMGSQIDGILRGVYQLGGYPLVN